MSGSPRVIREADELPLGSGAIAGTSYDIDVRALAAALGFSRISRNSLDVSGDRDVVAAFLHAAALGMVHLSRLSEDFILFTSEEFAFFDLADRRGDGQQPHAAEEESGSAGARARQEPAASSAI